MSCIHTPPAVPRALLKDPEIDALKQEQTGKMRWRQGVADQKGYMVDDDPAHLRILKPEQEIDRAEPRVELVIRWQELPEETPEERVDTRDLHRAMWRYLFSTSGHYSDDCRNRVLRACSSARLIP